MNDNQIYQELTMNLNHTEFDLFELIDFLFGGEYEEMYLKLNSQLQNKMKNNQNILFLCSYYKGDFA